MRGMRLMEDYKIFVYKYSLPSRVWQKPKEQNEVFKGDKNPSRESDYQC